MRYALAALVAGLSVMPQIARAGSPSRQPDADRSAPAASAHCIAVSGSKMCYRAIAATLPVGLDDGSSADMFYVSYARAQTAPARPIIFAFNGGPGSASLWLDLGSFGPRRLVTRSPLPSPASAIQLVDNQQTLLDAADLVFVDAVGTGYSRALAGVDARTTFWGVDQDVDGFARAIARYLTIADRWASPKFLFGESYGTARAAALALKLHNQGIDCNGVVLMSTILNFSDELPDREEGPVGLLPTYAATAWYHHRSAERPAVLLPWLDRVRAFAQGPYAQALAAGDALPEQQADAVARTLSGHTGLSVAYWRQSGLRVDMERFRSELLRNRGLIVGRFDSRFTEAAAHADDGVAVDPATNDPATAGVSGALLSTYRDYIGRVIGFRSDLQYRALYNSVIEPPWDMHHHAPGYGFALSSPDTALDLASAMRANPNMKIMAIDGLFDMATPFFKTEYDIAHMQLAPALRANIRVGTYATGYMAYVDTAALTAIKRDLDAFYDAAGGR